MIFSVHLRADTFPPVRTVTGVTDRDFATFAGAQEAALSIPHVGRKRRAAVRQNDLSSLARWTVRGGEITITRDDL